MWDLLRISKPAVASSTDVGCGDGNNGPDVRIRGRSANERHEISSNHESNPEDDHLRRQRVSNERSCLHL